MLETVDKWETHYLRKMFWFRCGWEREQNLKHTSNFLKKIRAETQTPHLAHRLLTMHFKHLYKVEWATNPAKKELKDIRDYRDRLWWDAVKKENYKRRKLEGVLRSRVGKMYLHDDLVSKYLGNDWKHQIAEYKTLKQWMKATNSTRATILKEAKVAEDPRTYVEKTQEDKREEREEKEERRNKTKRTQALLNNLLGSATTLPP